jgi:glycyl-tRNA synthetase alpha subunit
MKLEVYNDEIKLDIENIKFKDFNQETQYIKDLFSNIEIDFSSISTLKGDKKMLEKSFQQQRAESLNL